MKAHDKEELPIKPEKYKLQLRQIKQNSIAISDSNIVAILNLRSNYSKAMLDDEYAMLVFDGLNSLISSK